jgi:hypothetical protein
VFEAADVPEWRGHDVVDADGHKIGELGPSTLTPAPTCRRSARSGSGCRPGTGSCSCPSTGRRWVPGYLKVSYDKKQVKDAPSIGTDGELPAGDEEAIFKHYGLIYEPGGGERRLARR